MFLIVSSIVDIVLIYPLPLGCVVSPAELLLVLCCLCCCQPYLCLIIVFNCLFYCRYCLNHIPCGTKCLQSYCFFFTYTIPLHVFFAKCAQIANKSPFSASCIFRFFFIKPSDLLNRRLRFCFFSCSSVGDLFLGRYLYELYLIRLKQFVGVRLFSSEKNINY